MQLIALSHCRKRAIAHTRRVLDNYGHRIGAATWQLRASREGLGILVAALHRSATRGTAVTIYQVDGFQAKTLRVAAHVGHRRHHDGERYAIAVTRPKSVTSSVAARAVRDISAYARSAGFLHDLGKNTRGVQAKLAKPADKTADPIRHEILSLLVRREKHATFGERLAACAATPPSWLGSYRDPETGALIPSKVLDWLIASHHRLPGGNQGSLTENQHLIVDADRTAMQQAADPGWRPPDVPEALALPLPTVDPDCQRAFFLWARAALMMADHYVSSITPESEAAEGASAFHRQVVGRLGKMVRPEAAQPNQVQLMANSRRRQNLDEHLKAVGRCAGILAKAIAPGKIERLLPALAGELDDIAGTQGTFAWQSRMQQAITDMPGTGGLFLLVNAGTGTGKTRGCAVAANAACTARGLPKRFTVALGLRNLTLQTGDEYLDQLKLSPSQVSVLIGSRVHRDLHNASHDNDEEELVVANGCTAVLPEYLQAQLGRTSVNYLATPVLVTTVDQIINAADFRRTRWIAPWLRLRSGPLVLDEIDQYDLKDLPAVARLVFMTGLSGQPIILSSATTYPAVAQHLFRAYQAGWREHAHLWGQNPVVSYGLFAEFADTCVPGQKAFEDTYLGFRGVLQVEAAAAAQQQARRRARLSQHYNSRTQMFDVIHAGIHELHRYNASDVDGLRVSFGMVRLARVSDVLSVLMALANRSDTEAISAHTRVVFVPYHANMVLAVRSEIERRLDRALKRKDNPLAYLEDSDVQRVMAEARAAGQRNVIIVAVVSPVEEVGRDHDFDWQVIEPSSGRSIIQCIGRAVRHRYPDFSKRDAEWHNIIVLRRPARVFDSGYKERRPSVYTRPGFEINGELAGKHEHDIGEHADWIDGQYIHAGPCLLPEDGSGLTAYENKRIDVFMQSEFIDAFLDRPATFMESTHYTCHRFRDSDESLQLYLDPRDDTIRDAEGGEVMEVAAIKRRTFVKTAALLFPLEPMALAHALAERLQVDAEAPEFARDYFSFSLRYGGTGTTEFDPVVGFRKVR